MKKLLLPLLVAFAVSLVSCGGEKKEDKKVNEDSIKVAKEKAKEDSLKAAEAKKNDISSQDETFAKDSKGQWVVKATASSTYATKKGKDAAWSPEQMIGEPNVKKYGDNGNAWASKSRDGQEEWVKLTFEKEVNATEVRIRETYNPGAIVKIELIDTKNKSHVVYEATAAAKEAKMGYLVASFAKTEYKTKTVKITLDSKAVSGWNEIDAVQLVGE